MALRSLILLLLCSAASLANAEPRQLALVVGDSEVVHFPPGTDLSVSRRGVVDLFHAGGGKWEITALKSGFAVIDGRDGATGEARPPRIFVTVGSSAAARPTVDSPTGPPAWICRPKGIRCAKDAGIITGVTDDPLWFQRAADFCSRNDACLFAVDLSARGQASRKGRYRLAAKIFLIESGAAAELGFDGDVRVALAAPKGSADISLLSRLRALAQDHKAEILGEPLFRMTPGEDVQLVNGGEFQVLERSRDVEGRDVAAWKQHGLALGLSLLPLGTGRARLTYDLSLKSPTASRTSLTVNSLRSQVDLPVGTPVLVGILDLEAKTGSQRLLPPFSGIPLIGPFFRGSDEQSSRSRLGFWLHLAEDTDDALTGPWTGAGPP